VMVKPGSFVGSVGVVYDLSIPESLTDDNFTSGPFKADGYAVAQFVRDLELVKEYFAGVVYAERSLAWDRWRDTRELFPHTQDSLATGRIWTGVAAVEVGIADGFGSVSDAIAKAAELAGLREYRVVHLNDAFMQAAGYTLSGEAAPESLEDVEQRVTEGTDFWYVYMPPAG
jgi:protease IV